MVLMNMNDMIFFKRKQQCDLYIFNNTIFFWNNNFDKWTALAGTRSRMSRWGIIGADIGAGIVGGVLSFWSLGTGAEPSAAITAGEVASAAIF
jgi:hypothetical protein